MIKRSTWKKKIILSFLLVSLSCCYGCSDRNFQDKSTEAASYELDSNKNTASPSVNLSTPTATSPVPSPTPTIEPVTYKGTVQHIFFHPLIAYTERAFDNDSMSEGYNNWMITVEEFKKILNSLYEKNFILVDHALCSCR